MAVKKKKKDKNYRASKKTFWGGNTIWFTLAGCLFFMLICMMLITITLSDDIVKSLERDDKYKFYKNIFEVTINEINTIQKSQSVSSDLKKEYQLNKIMQMMNKKLTQDNKIKDVLIIDKKTNLEYYTTFDNEKGDIYTYNKNSLFPLVVKQSANYTVLNYYVIPFTAMYNNAAYDIYIVVPKPNPEYRNNLRRNVFLFDAILLLICLAFLFIVVRSITKPLITMETTVSQIAKGDLSGRLDLTKYEEINKLVVSYNMMANALQRLYSSLEAKVNDRTQELKGAYAELQSTQAMMVHSEKMKSLGELVAGIMHEINNPINFIYGNMTHLSTYSNDLINMIDEYTKYEASLKSEEKTHINSLKEKIDYEFLKSDMPDLIKSCKEGAERAKNIIQDLKSFSRMEEVSIKDVDLPSEIDTVLNILHNKIKNKAEVHKEYMDKVPKVEAFGGQLNQVFMNIIDNAVGAIEKTGDIWIRINTDELENNLIIEIEDNGSGMDEETMKKVFDPFFTTKPVGKGTGLGMSITYKIIKNHQGDITVESKQGQGTKFIITLPLNIDREKLKTSVLDGGNKE